MARGSALRSAADLMGHLLSLDLSQHAASQNAPFATSAKLAQFLLNKGAFFIKSLIYAH
jgi:hypothetical protein